MSLLQALNLPRLPAGAATAEPAVDPKAIEQSKQQFDTVFKSAIAYAATLGEDKPIQAALIKALVACDAKRREANQFGGKDAARQKALLDAAIASVSVSRTQGEEAIAKARATGGDKPEAARATSKPSTTVAQALGKDTGGEDEHGHDAASAALAASQKSGGNVAKSTTVNEKKGPLPGEKTTTTTTASVDKGVANINRTTDTRGVGAEGVSVGQKVETERATAEGNLKKTSEVKGTLGPEGLKVETKKGSEYKGKDGRTLSVETETSADIGLEGAKGAQTKTVQRRDGTSEATTVSGGVERGDGKAAVVSGASHKSTDANRTETTVSGEKKRGILAGEDGYGAMTEDSASFARQRKNGFKTNAKLTFGANISCKIGEGEGTPPMFPVTLTVSFAASVATGSGYEKKGPEAKSKLSVDAKFAAAARMEVVNHLTEEQVHGYLESLEAAAKGGKADATYNELVIVSVGASETWDVAKRMYLGDGPGAAVGKATGDSAKVSDEVDAEVSAKGNLRAAKFEAQVKKGSKSSTELTRTASGGLDVNRQTEDSDGQSLGAGVDTGLTGVMIKGGREMKTLVGFLVTIEAADDPKGELLRAFKACKTPARQQAFIDANKGKIKLKEMTRGSEEGKSSGVEFSLFGAADLTLAGKGKVAKTTRTDGEGKLIGSEVVGTQDSGGSGGVGEFFRASDARKDTVTSKSDGEGNVSVDVKRERTSSNFVSKVKNVIGMGDEPKKKTGLLEDVAGGKKADTDDHYVFGVRLGKEDIARIVERAGNARNWSDMAWGVGSTAAIMQWSALGRDIAAKGKADPKFVADGLAIYIGDDKGRRMDVLMRLMRPGGDVSVGKRSEFPKSLQPQAKAYDELVLRGVAGLLEVKAKSEGVAAAGTWGQEQFKRLENMLLAVRQAEDFANGAVQIEMMAAINARKEELLAAMRKNAGKTGANDEAEAATRNLHRILFEIEKFPEIANKSLEHLRKMAGRSGRFYNDNLGDALDEVNSLADTYAHWQAEYDKAVALAKKLGKPESECAKAKPDLTEYQRFRKVCGLSS